MGLLWSFFPIAFTDIYKGISADILFIFCGSLTGIAVTKILLSIDAFKYGFPVRVFIVAPVSLSVGGGIFGFMAGLGGCLLQLNPQLGFKSLVLLPFSFSILWVYISFLVIPFAIISIEFMRFYLNYSNQILDLPNQSLL